MLATKLVNLGHQVTIIDLLKYSSTSLNHLHHFKNFRFIKADIRNKNIMKKLISKNEYILPFAGLVGAPLCEKYKKDAISINYQAVKDCVNLCNKKQKLIFEGFRFRPNRATLFPMTLCFRKFKAELISARNLED